MCRKWKEEWDRNPSIPPFKEWVQGAPERDALDVTKPKTYVTKLQTYTASDALYEDEGFWKPLPSRLLNCKHMIAV
jgi:hypothetical protein